MNPLKVLLVHYNASEPGQAGGAESAIRDQRDALQRLGHEVHIEFIQPERAWNRLKPDIVHFHTVHVQMGLEVLARAQQVGIPHVLSLHDYWPFCSGRMLLRTGTYAGADHAESCSAVEGMCDEICDSCASPEDVKELINKSPTVTFNPYSAEIFERHGVKIDAVIPHGVDTDFFSPPAERNGASVVTVSAWPTYPTKGMYVLREALKREGLEATLVSGVSRTAVRDELRRHSIMVFPSCYQETWGLCLTEAMACGCACIASDVAGPRAQIYDGLNGLLFPNGDSTALSKALRTLIDNVETREGLADNARINAVANYGLDRMGRDYETLYRQVRGY